jgi:NAD(P)-dependent dehydrogenase (short-subunit alcohol dehydrogenase family)
VIITGASSGIGLAIARSYAADGVSLVLNARDEAKLSARIAELATASKRVLVAGDIGQVDTSKRLIAAAERAFGGADVLINCAGIFQSKPVVDYTPAEIDEVLGMNLRGTILVTQAMVAHLRARRSGGAIITMTSAISLSPMAAIPASVPNATKGALNAFTRSLALELASEKIRVAAVAPGLIETPLLGDDREQLASMNGLQPIGHIGDPQDIVAAVRYLASQPFVTGVVLPVDGGMSLGHW